MKIFAYIFPDLLGLFILIYVIWFIFSRWLLLPCPSWLHWMVELENPFTKTSRVQALIMQLDLKPGMRVLDAGCGPGRLTIPAAQNVGPRGEIVALDLQAGMLRRVKEKAQKANLHNIRYLLAKLGESKLEPNYYDRILLVAVLGEIPDRAAALQEVYHALKPGGILLISEIIFNPHFQGRRTATQLVEAVGFQVQGIFGNRFAYTMKVAKP